MSERKFRRKVYGKMLEWKTTSKGRSALLLEGARRIGKSTIVEEFAKKEYSSYILIDFNEASQDVKDLFENLMDLDYIFLYLQNIYQTSLYEHESVIVFDEVQQCPKARQAIKYLVKDGRYDYIETGSLISIHKNTKDINIPSEEHRVEMFPMDYEEFRWALGDETGMSLLKQVFEKRMSLGEGINRMKMRDLRLYMLVGGMPQAVNEYLDTKNLQNVDLVKRQIIQLYADDFRKIDPTGRISKLFMSIPSQLSRNLMRYQPTPVVGNIPSDKIDELLLCLEDSKTINIAYHADDPYVGMSLTMDYGKYKLYVGDTGLFVTLAFWDKDFTENIIYNKLLSDKLSANMGYVYENLVAQMLRASGDRLFYYTFPKDKTHFYEIDFLLSRGNKLCPIEVKSSGYKTHASLDAFCRKFSDRIGQRYLIYTKDLQKDEQTLLLPVYMTPLV
ncbi:MAG: AAA family ATPase [Prevotella sp.]|jgi:predicted AAA+ superfamily ATPase|nr:AAA family ATPase [Prevotella sp.]